MTYPRELTGAGWVIGDVDNPPALWSDSTGTALVRPDGTSRDIWYGYQPPFDPEPPSFISASAVTDGPAVSKYDLAAVLPNPYTQFANTPIHPSVLFVPGGWNGYRYWMAWTPYPNSDAELENPCVAASNDLLTWVTPAPIPLAESPPGSGFNADPYLFFNADRSIMYLAWRERGLGSNIIRAIETTDGRSWSAPRTIISGTQGVQDYASMSIWWNGSGWTMVTHQLDASAPWPVERRVSTSADLYGGFGVGSTVTIPVFAGRSWWASHCKRLSSGQVVALFQDNAGSPGQAGNLYWAESFNDGATFQVGALVERTGGKYNSSFTLRPGAVDLFIGTLATITRIACPTNRLQIQDQYRAAQAAILGYAANAQAGVLWADTFNRADSAASLGTATSGGTYTASSGTWGISTNRAYPVASGRVLANVSTPNHVASVRFLDMTTGVQQWLIARAVDGSNLWRLGATSPTASGFQTLALQTVVAASVQDTFIAGQFVRGDVIALECVGTTVSVYVNGVLTFSTQSALHIAGASVGMQANLGANTFMDDFIVQSRAL